MPKYGLKKPVDQKQQSKLIKRPVRKPESAWSAPQVQDLEDDEEEETKGEGLPSLFNECDFKISPNKNR